MQISKRTMFNNKECYKIIILLIFIQFTTGCLTNSLLTEQFDKEEKVSVIDNLNRNKYYSISDKDQS